MVWIRIETPEFLGGFFDQYLPTTQKLLTCQQQSAANQNKQLFTDYFRKLSTCTSLMYIALRMNISEITDTYKLKL